MQSSSTPAYMRLDILVASEDHLVSHRHALGAANDARERHCSAGGRMDGNVQVRCGGNWRWARGEYWAFYLRHGVLAAGGEVRARMGGSEQATCGASPHLRTTEAEVGVACPCRPRSAQSAQSIAWRLAFVCASIDCSAASRSRWQGDGGEVAVGLAA